MYELVENSNEHKYLKVMLHREIHLKYKMDKYQETNHVTEANYCKMQHIAVKESVDLFCNINRIPLIDVISVQSLSRVERSSNLSKKREKRGKSEAWKRLYDIAQELLQARSDYHAAMNNADERAADRRADKARALFNFTSRNMSLNSRDQEEFLKSVKLKGEDWNDYYKQ